MRYQDLLRQDLSEPVEAATEQKRLRARWLQGFKTGVRAERKRVAEAVQASVVLQYLDVVEIVAGEIRPTDE